MAWPNDYAVGSPRSLLLNMIYPGGITGFVAGTDIAWEDLGNWFTAPEYDNTVLVLPAGEYSFPGVMTIGGNRYVCGADPVNKPILNFVWDGDPSQSDANWGLNIGDSSSGGNCGLMDVIVNFTTNYNADPTQVVFAIRTGAGSLPLVGVEIRDVIATSSVPGQVVGIGGAIQYAAGGYLIDCAIGTGTFSGGAGVFGGVIVWTVPGSPQWFLNSTINNPNFSYGYMLAYFGSEYSEDDFDLRNSIIQINPSGTPVSAFTVGDMATYPIASRPYAALNAGLSFDGVVVYELTTKDGQGLDMTTAALPYASDINDVLFVSPWDRGCYNFSGEEPEPEENTVPGTPTLITPIEGSTITDDTTITTALSVSVYDADSNTMAVSFYNGQNLSLIGSTSVVASGIATVPWGSLQLDQDYSWYVTVSDGTVTVTGTVNTFHTAASIVDNFNFITLSPIALGITDDTMIDWRFGGFRANVSIPVYDNEDNTRRGPSFIDKIENPVDTAERDRTEDKTIRKNSFEFVGNELPKDDTCSDGVRTPESNPGRIHRKPNRWGF